ncbi:hypothetical protein H9643_08265 [Ochrobactrum sp. Sa2BUA5]|jgi:hypothetical protein|nr:hypothetical protein [Ochrobactrum gallinarum]
MSTWKTIDTAPLDGTIVDLWTDMGRITNCAFKHNRGLNGASVGTKGWFGIRFDGMVSPVPSHWMLPPEPPEDV